MRATIRALTAPPRPLAPDQNERSDDTGHPRIPVAVDGDRQCANSASGAGHRLGYFEFGRRLDCSGGLIPVDQVVTTRGLVVSQSPNIIVQPLETAIVRSIDVREGQRVRAGQLLARLDATFASADLQSLAMQVSTLEAEVARLKAEAEGKPSTMTVSIRAGPCRRPSSSAVRRSTTPSLRVLIGSLTNSAP